MKSIKYTILLNFVIIAAITITVLGIVVSWRMSESISYQSRQISHDMTIQTYESLKSHYHMLMRSIHEDIRRIASALPKNPHIITNLENIRTTAMESLLEQTAQTEGLDFAMLFNTEGYLLASFPRRLRDIDVEKVFNSWELGVHAQQFLKGEAPDETPPIWNMLSKHDPRELHVFGLGDRDINGKGAMSISASGIIHDDFGDPIGIFLIGKLLNHYNKPLKWVYEVTNSTSVIYLDNTPITQAGFERSEEEEFDLSALQVPEGMFSKIYEADTPRDIVLTLADELYLTTCSALGSSDDGKFGVVCLGVPEARIAKAKRTISLYGYETRRNVQIWILGFGIGSLILFAIMSVIVATRIVSPIKQLSRLANVIAIGNFQQDFTVNSRDEIGDLANSLRKVVRSFREITTTSEAIARGDLKQEVTPRSDQDTLGQALQHMAVYLHEMASVAATITEGDLTREVHLHSEADTFGQTIRTMTDGLRSLIQQIRTSAEQIAATERNISSLTDQEVNIVQRVQTSVKEMVSTMTEMGISVKQVAQNMNVLTASVEDTSSSVSEMTNSITNIASNVTDLAQHTERTISTLNESVRTLENVTEKTTLSRQLSQETMQDALEGQEAVEQVRESMDAIARTNHDAVETITRFEKQSRDIGTILDVIRDITDQSSLLALNASIISAQAGSHGKGFSVIAEEMRNLANEVGASTKNISTIVGSLQEDINTVVEMIHAGTAKIDQGVTRTQQAQEKLRKIISSAERSSTVVSEIADALKVQMTTSHEVMDDMKQVNSMTVEITRSTNEQQTTAVQIRNVVENINDMASQTQESTTQQLEGVHLVLKAAEQISTLTNQNRENSQRINRATAAELAEQAKTLVQSVDRFKLRPE